MATVNPALFSALEWRCVGPHRGGRVVAVAGDPVDPMVFYFGACVGGLWKTDDGGTYWRNVSDGFFKTSAVGAVAAADSDPNVIYVGMGEACMRGNVSHGDNRSQVHPVRARPDDAGSRRPPLADRRQCFFGEGVASPRRCPAWGSRTSPTACRYARIPAESSGR